MVTHVEGELDLRDKTYPQIVSCSNTRNMNPHIIEDKGHNDVIHVTLVTREEYNGNSLLVHDIPPHVKKVEY